jgi:hypothetical protein
VEPSVKGSIVLGAVVTVKRHRKEGRVLPEQLAARLSGGALALLEQKIDIGRWYPIAHFSELLELDWSLARLDPDHMRRQGVDAANRLFESHIYQQLQYAERSGKAKSREDLFRQAKLITTITGTLYSFLQFEVRPMPDRNDQLEILYRNATAFTEALRYTTEGFMNQINLRQGSKRRWTSERLSSDLVAFRLPLPSHMGAERA